VTESEWLSSSANPMDMICFVYRRKARVFACAVARHYWAYLVDERSRRAVEVAERCDPDPDEWGLTELAIAHEEAERALGEIRELLAAGDHKPKAKIIESAAYAALYTTYRRPSEAGMFVIQTDAMVDDEHLWPPLLREIYGNPFQPLTFDPRWRTDTAVALARQMYESRDFSAMPILADALQDAGCDSDDVLNHCRGPGPHVRGCWVVDLVLGKG
jgi:hypothetical protein